MGSCWSRKQVEGPSIKVLQRLPLPASPGVGGVGGANHLRVFSFKELKTATDNFPEDGGEGGVGGVFKGWIDPAEPGRGLPVLVKFLKPEGLQPVREWLAEVNFLGSLDHPNLVKLYGYCCERGHRLLVYELVARGSLVDHLFLSSSGGAAAGSSPHGQVPPPLPPPAGADARPLPWNTRLEIALGAAQGMAYLHQGSRERRVVMYRDFKTTNVLLDADYTTKLTDYGMADELDAANGGAGGLGLCDGGDTNFVSTRVMATHGYGAPEFVMSGVLVPKSNVYSFGVVLLELVTGRRAVDKSRPSGEQNLVEWARPYLRSERQTLFQIADPLLQGRFSMKAAWKAGRLAHRCLSLDPRLRPAMSDVVDALEALQGLNDMAADDPNYARWCAAPLAPPRLRHHRGGFNSGGSQSMSGLLVDDEMHISEYQAQLRAMSESYL